MYNIYNKKVDANCVVVGTMKTGRRRNKILQNSKKKSWFDSLLVKSSLKMVLKYLTEKIPAITRARVIIVKDRRSHMREVVLSRRNSGDAEKNHNPVIRQKLK